MGTADASFAMSAHWPGSSISLTGLNFIHTFNFTSVRHSGFDASGGNVFGCHRPGKRLLLIILHSALNLVISINANNKKHNYS